ncbi:SAM-dependent methyltransferase [Thermodesulfobacteriota bacterium]
MLLDSGLYEELINRELLIPHREVDPQLALTEEAQTIIEPEYIPFISYPYEWSFSQLKDAALLTLDIQKIAMSKGMTLRDSSAYNVQFLRGKPVFIDTLSFGKLREGEPWSPYGQFCRHFLAPLALMSHVDIRLNQLLRANIDGIPLDLASSLLPWSTKINMGLGFHIHLHAKSQKKYEGTVLRSDEQKRKLSKKSMLALIDSLHSSISKLSWKPGGTEWYDYYQANNNYGETGLEEKERLVSDFLSEISPKIVWDLGANIGRFSRLASPLSNLVVSWDIDPGCVESNYGMVSRQKETNILPLLLDLGNPSPGIGWNNDERTSMLDRGPADTVLALGLIHHLAISNNTPLGKIASFLAQLCSSLIIEFVPKDDSQVLKLLATREDIFPGYTQAGFEEAFSEYFKFSATKNIPATKRSLYLMHNRKAQ